jgi:hypothetical protein
MMPDDPLYDRVLMFIVRYVFLPTMILLGLGIVFCIAAELVQLLIRTV